MTDGPSTPPPRTLLSLPAFTSVSKARLSSLYSDFSHQRTSNPPGFAANVAWWSALLSAAADRGLLPSREEKGGALVLDYGEEMMEELRVDGGGRPLGLGGVVFELQSSQALYPLETFLSSPTSIYATPSIPLRIASTLIARPLWWSLQQLNIVSSEPAAIPPLKKLQGRYVLRSALEKAAANLIAHFQTIPHSSIADVLFSPASFRTTFASNCLPGVTLSDKEVDVMLRYLERDRRVLVRDGEVIKFDPGAAPVEAISLVDKGVLEMTTTVEKINVQISELESRVAERQAKLTAALKASQKDRAMTHLRSRNQLSTLLTARLQSLSHLQEILLKIETSHGDIAILKIYDTSTETLKTLLRDPRLDRTKVDETMDGMADVLADQAEIERAVGEGGEAARRAAGEEDEDEAELEDELRAMVKEEEERKELERREKEEKEEKERERIKAAEEKRRKATEEEERRRKVKREEEARKNEAEAKLAAAPVETSTLPADTAVEDVAVRPDQVVAE